MRITDGRYVLTSKSDIEGALKRKDNMVQEHKDSLVLVREITRAMLNLHQPYVSRGTEKTRFIDVSICPPERMKEALAAQLTESVWCCECGSSWPCKQIKPLRELRDILGRNGSSDNEALAALIEKIQPQDHEGKVITAL